MTKVSVFLNEKLFESMYRVQNNHSSAFEECIDLL